MAWIQPNTDITLYRGYPCAGDKHHTLWFDTRAHQISYFNGLLAHNFLSQSYQRVDRDKCRLAINAEEIYDYNYMSFVNTSFGNKTFYAFVTNIEYINHNVTEITYEIDDFQTWFFELTNGTNKGLCDCYVERQHAESDEVGEHILAEPVDVGEHIVDSVETAGFNNMSIVMNVTWEGN